MIEVPTPVIASEVSHARIAIIADRLVVGCTGRTLLAGVDRWSAHSPGGGTRSTCPPGCPASPDGGPHRGGLRGGGRLPLLRCDRGTGRGSSCRHRSAAGYCLG